MSEQKQEVLSHELLAAIGDYGHAKYRHDNDIITLGAWEDLITAIKVWNRSALAAKDARIAELEGLLREMDSGWDLPPYFQHCIEQLLRDSSRFTWDLQNPESLRTRIDDALSAQQQANPTSAKSSLVAATPSEDGQEVPEVVAFLMKPDFCEPYVSLRRDSNTFSNCEPLMTVAQHERIVAEYEARIERQVSQKIEAYRKHDALVIELRELRAQPARQVGGDEPKVPNYKFKFETLVEHCKRQDQVIAELRYDENIRRFYDDGAVWFWCGDETDNLSTLACPVVINAGDLRELLARAALAPAAVAVDGSASLVNALEQVRTMVGNDEYSDDVIGFINQSICNHARLNRRAIPEGLLERVEHLLACPQHHTRPEYISAAAELRALLGKS